MYAVRIYTDDIGMEESWRLEETYCHSKSSEKPSANADGKKTRKAKNNNNQQPHNFGPEIWNVFQRMQSSGLKVLVDFHHIILEHY